MDCDNCSNKTKSLIRKETEGGIIRVCKMCSKKMNKSTSRKILSKNFNIY